MKLNISLEESHWLRYAILTFAATVKGSPQHETYLEILTKLDEAEQASLADEDYYADDGDRLPKMNQDDPNRPGVGDQF